MDKDGAEMKIKYLNEIKPHLFRGMVNEKCVLIKYTEWYGKAVHQLLADNRLAPELLATQQVGRFTAVVMVELESAVNIAEFLIKHHDQKSELLCQCKNVLEVLGTKNFVHGDLRPCNILVSERQVYITDFDWAGKENEVTYPLYLNHSEISWPHGAADGLGITSEHDRYWIEQLEKL
jgi:serine/threonine protein kinase